jgi:hypothetical protein
VSGPDLAPDFGREAHDLAALGWAVFPLQPGQKKPYGFTTGLKAASPDPETVTAWWAGRKGLPLRPPKSPDERMPRAVVPQPRSNIGMATGPASGVWVLDVDGADGIASLMDLANRFGRLPPTVRQHTGGGGGQLFYRWPGVLPWGSVIRNSASAPALGEHLDVRGDGGYVVLPPSIHPSGRPYRWVEGCAPWETEPASAPWWLLRIVAPPPEAPRPPRREAPRREGEGAGYAAGALRAAETEIAAAGKGTRNATFHRNAYGIGRLVAGGVLARETARAALIDAGLRMGGGDPEYGEARLAWMVEHAFKRAVNAPRSGG